MDDKKARLTVLIDPQNKEDFDALCSSNNVSSSEVVRQLIVGYLRRHGVMGDAPEVLAEIADQLPHHLRRGQVLRPR